MSTESYDQARAKALADLQEALHDEEQLSKHPEQHIAQAIAQAERAAAQGVIDAGDLREMREWADSALSSSLG
jgi:hypothetical protein